MFKIIYFAGLIIMAVIRSIYGRPARMNQVVERRKPTSKTLLLLLLSMGMVVIPAIYASNPLFHFADYSLASWIGWIGTVILAIGLWLFWRSHADLGRYWSPTLELKEGHQLITGGVYKYMRHPMYSSIWIITIAQVLLLQNWIAGWSFLVTFALLYFSRVSSEEKMMLDRFGEEYQLYMDKTGRVMPRFWK